MADPLPAPDDPLLVGPNEETPLIHPDELQAQRQRAMQAKAACPFHSMLVILVFAILMISMPHPGIDDKPEQDKHCQPLITWLTVYTALSATSLLVSIMFMWHCCYDLLQFIDVLISLAQFGVFIWGIVVVLQVGIGMCDHLLWWTIAFIVFIGPLISCCFVLVFVGFAAGLSTAAMMKEEKGPEATPDLAKAAEEAAVVKGNVTAVCPVCQETKLVQFASPCGHMLCEDCREQMQTMEERELGVRKCPTCRQPVNFFQGVYTMDKDQEMDSSV